MRLTNNGQEIGKEQIKEAGRWDRKAKEDGIEYAGYVEYIRTDGFGCLVPVTANELQQIEGMGIALKYLPTKYSGTY
jgi:hypothetical protein